MFKNKKLETRTSSDTSLGDLQAPPEFDEKETKRILRKIDVRVIPILATLYIFAHLDRSNIGNAKIAGMTEDIELSGNRYNVALTVFFATYIAFEVPCNMILKIARPSYWIATMVISWGIVMTLQGVVQSYEGLVITRVFLGMTESGFFPAAMYLLSTWYCRFETQSRISMFYSSGAMASAFSGLLAFAISKMAGIADLRGWRWIFIIEGIATVVLGGSLAFCLPDYPETAKFLTEEERRFIVYRLKHDGGTKTGEVGRHEKFNWRYLRAAVCDWHLYLSAVVYWGSSICVYGFNYTVPTIILQLGYEATIAQLLTVPIYTSGVISTIVLSIWADKKRTRWPFVTFPFFVPFLGLIGLLAIPHPKLPGLTYALLFTIPAGAYPAVNASLAWFSNNLAPSWKRSIGMALLNALGSAGGIIGSNIFLERQAPHYWLGYGFCLGIVFSSILSGFALLVLYSRANAKRDRLPVDEVKARYSKDELIMMGDKSPLYRYVV